MEAWNYALGKLEIIQNATKREKVGKISILPFSLLLYKAT